MTPPLRKKLPGDKINVSDIQRRNNILKTIKLNGIWELSEGNDHSLCHVQVPGTVLSGLLNAGKIEDPFYRTNEEQTRELFWKDYVFERSFSVEEDLLTEDQILLICEGLDTLTDIYINDHLTASTDNMHRTWKFSVKEYLKKGENQIRIVFHSVLQYIKNYTYAEHKEIHYVPSGGMKGNQLLRKAHSMFGWDWGPQTIDAGIFRDIYLEGFSHPRMEDIIFHQKHQDGKVTVTAEIQLGKKNIPLNNCCDHTVSNTVSPDYKYENYTVNIEISGLDYTRNQTLTADQNGRVTFTFDIENPHLWWPNGYGEQPLYNVTVTLQNNTDEILETINRRIGLRTLTISQEKDQWGSEFAFCVNGLKIFTRGGNYIPEDCLYTRISRETQKYLLESCKRANFNCVRVWGGGYYPSDQFYDLCDEMGLIVWQDLMYACNVYDVTKAFGESCRQETLDNVKRLRHHASLGLWCGNNEIESAWDHWQDFQTETPYLRADYVKLFEDILPDAVKETDQDTFYWPSSPSSGGCFDNPDDENRGDTHYWDVWHGQKPFTDYQKYHFRFCSEFGFQSFPCMKTVESYTEEKDRNIFSRVMESHQKNDAANGKILYYLSENFQYPQDLNHLLYVSQILQGMAMKYGVDHWRRNRGRCMGTLYWQVNDNWPVASWSSIDYFGRWKALHYMAKKFYAPLAVSMRRDEEIFMAYLENETAQTQEWTATISVKNMKCEILDSVQAAGSTSPFKAEEIIQIDVSNWKKQEDYVFVETVLKLSDGTVLTDTETLVPYKYVELETPEINIDVEEQKDTYLLKIKANCFVPFLSLDFKDADVTLEDNFFHITDTEEKVIRADKKDIRNGSFKNAQDMKNRLEILTLIPVKDGIRN